MAEEKMNLIQKVMRIRQEFSKAELKKSGHNQYAGYEYFELEDIVPKAMEICTACNVLPLISFTKDYAVMSIIDAESGEKLEITSPMAEAQLKGCHPIQNMGATETYSRRYLWMAFLEVTEPDPSDRTQGMPQNGWNQPAQGYQGYQNYQSAPSAQRPTVQPQNAPQPDNRPAVAPAQPQQAQGFDPRAVWREVMHFYGYDPRKSPQDPDNQDALKASHALFDPYAKKVEELTPEKGAALRERMRNLEAQRQKGPEDFQDDSAELGAS